MSKDELKADNPQAQAFPESDDFGNPERTKALTADALSAFRKLRRTHRSLFEVDSAGFRQLLRKCEGQVFNRKRGPKDDPIIAGASWEVVHGETTEDAFETRYPSNLKALNPNLYAGALENFTRKVKRYIRRHPRLLRIQNRRKKLARKPTGNTPLNPTVPESAG